MLGLFYSLLTVGIVTAILFGTSLSGIADMGEQLSYDTVTKAIDSVRESDSAFRRVHYSATLAKQTPKPPLHPGNLSELEALLFPLKPVRNSAWSFGENASGRHVCLKGQVDSVSFLKGLRRAATAKNAHFSFGDSCGTTGIEQGFPDQYPAQYSLTYYLQDGAIGGTNENGGTLDPYLVAPVFSLASSETTLQFGTITIGGFLDSEITVTNQSNQSATLGLMSVETSLPEFTWSTDCEVTLPANQTCGIAIRFTPADATLYSGTLSVHHYGGVLQVALSGTGILPP